MKVFLSWSGDASHKIAMILRDWLPSVLQHVKPYVSSQDIDKGSRWSTDIAKELAESSYGVLCITRENIEAPWINFEAGALSKAIDKSYVSPFLVNLKRSEVQGPLLQFQSTIYEKDDLLKLVVSINNRAEQIERLESSAVKKAFEVWWPQFEVEMKKLESIPVDSKKKETSRQDSMLEEILDLTRTQQKLLRSPEELFPPDYLENVLSRGRRDLSTAPHSSKESRRMHESIVRLNSMFREEEFGKIKEVGLSLISEIHDLYHQVFETRLRRRPRPASEKVESENPD